jgi:hypothetical protein
VRWTLVKVHIKAYHHHPQQGRWILSLPFVVVTPLRRLQLLSYLPKMVSFLHSTSAPAKLREWLGLTESDMILDVHCRIFGFWVIPCRIFEDVAMTLRL